MTTDESWSMEGKSPLPSSSLTFFSSHVGVTYSVYSLRHNKTFFYFINHIPPLLPASYDIFSTKKIRHSVQ